MASAKSTPRDAQIMTAILKDMGVTDYEPRIINQMLEFTYRYITDILDDAKMYSGHASKKNIDAEDVKLAVQCRMDHSYTSPPPRDLLMEVAGNKNSQPLPLIKPYTGPKLPPDRFCLCSANYKLKSVKKPRINIAGSNVTPSSLLTPTRMALSHNTPGKAASTITLPSGALAMTNRSVAQPTVTIVTRPASTASSVTTPIVRFTTSTASAAAGGSISQKILAQPTSVVTTNVNPLKRKLEDNDYDQP